MRTAEHLGARPRLFAGWVSVASAVLIYLVTKYLDPSNALVYTIVGSLIISSVAAKIAGQKLGENAVAEQMCRLRNLPYYIVARKSVKPYMSHPITDEVVSITTQKAQTLCLDGKDALLLKGKRVAIVDDVISTGESLLAIERLVKKVGGDIVARAAILAEGDAAKRDDILFLEPLPLFPLD